MNLIELDVQSLVLGYIVGSVLMWVLCEKLFTESEVSDEK